MPRIFTDDSSNHPTHPYLSEPHHNSRWRTATNPPTKGLLTDDAFRVIFIYTLTSGPKLKESYVTREASHCGNRLSQVQQKQAAVHHETDEGDGPVCLMMHQRSLAWCTARPAGAQSSPSPSCDIRTTACCYCTCVFFEAPSPSHRPLDVSGHYMPAFSEPRPLACLFKVFDFSVNTLISPISLESVPW